MQEINKYGQVCEKDEGRLDEINHTWYISIDADYNPVHEIVGRC